MAYEVASVDLCAAGYERLRSQSEIILIAYPTLGYSIWDLRDELIGDLNANMQRDGFDFAAAKEAIHQYFADEWTPINNLIAMSAPEQWEEEMEGGFYLYLECEA